MSTILTVKVNHDPTSGAFSFALSHFDGQTTWTAPDIANGGTIAFTNSGHYTMTAPSRNPIQFDTLDVGLGTGLTPLHACDAPDQPFDLSSIKFPVIPPGLSSCVHANQWCENTSTGGTRPHFEDLALGLSNTTGTTAVAAPTFSKCTCFTC